MEAYGPYDNGVVGIFISKALKNEDLVVNNGGVDTTDFLYVEDLCEAVELALGRMRQLVKPSILGLVLRRQYLT